MSTTHVNVYIVSSNRLLRESLAGIMNRKSNLRAYPIQQLTQEPLQSQDKMTSSVLLFDAASVVLDEIAGLCGSSHKPHPWTTIVLGIEEDEEVFINLVQSGVRGFILRDATATDVVAAVRAAACGDVVCPASLCQFLFQYIVRKNSDSRRISKGSFVPLSRREMQIVPWIARGLTNKEIAARLGLAEQTIKNHVHNILRKTEVEDRQGVLGACRRQGTEISVEEIERIMGPNTH
jgi:DNA-binding NarL/FixJ family response regulator